VFGELDAVVIGPLMEFVVLGGAGIGPALEERSDVAFALLILHIEPRRTAERFDHGVESGAGLASVFLADIVAGLGARAVRDGEREEGHSQGQEVTDLHSILDDIGQS
jgi:hypothetical protein